MDLLILSVVAFFVIWSYLIMWRARTAAAKLPPGPYPFPIIGNIHQLGKFPHQSLAKLSKAYGPLLSLHLGSLFTIVVSSPEIASEILHKNDQAFSGRNIPAALVHSQNSMGFLPIGNKWRKLRKLCREHMFSVPRLEASRGLRQEKLQKLFDYVTKCCNNSQVLNVGEAAFITTLNLMAATLFSIEVTDFDSDATQEFMTTFQSLIHILAAPNVADFFPVLKPLDPQGLQRKFEFLVGKLLGFIEDLINQRLESRSKQQMDSSKKMDFLETLLDLREGSEYEFNIQAIKQFLLDLFVAGAETTAATVEWAMTELLLNPKKLSKAKHELRTVIGENKLVQESDISGLPYFQAVIKEVFRLHPAAPLLIPHLSEYNVVLSGYTIPKGAQMIVNVWAMGRDTKIWVNPDSFEPERFLDKEIGFKGHDFELIPFGSGRRICPGLPLADRLLHSMVATLIHNFDWKLQVGAEAEDVHKRELFGLSLRKAVPLMAIPIKCEA